MIRRPGLRQDVICIGEDWLAGAVMQENRYRLGKDRLLKVLDA